MVFLCPAEPPDPADPRPAPGTPEFVKMYRDLDLSKETDFSRCTSYAGPDWKRFAPTGPGRAGEEPRLWACDRCRDGRLHHPKGLAVLYADSGKVGILDSGQIPGGGEKIVLGPDSPDALLKKVIFNLAR